MGELMTITSINPYTNEIIKEYNEMTFPEIESTIINTHQAFQDWRKTSFIERSNLMKGAAKILKKNAREYGELMTLEMGKVVKSGIAEAEKCSWVCDYYADNAEKFLKPEIIGTDAGKSYITYNPLGVVLAIMPWNFPFWQVFRFAAPALMAGNVGVLKHASNVPGCALAIENIFKEAGFPENVFRTLLIGSGLVGNVIENPLVKAVTLTGSTPAGRAVAKKSGEMLKKTVLELGGNDPYVILEDADLESAVQACFTSKLINSGQSCIAAKRFIVVESIKEQFEKLFMDLMRNVKMGDPMRDDTVLGPLARNDLRDELHEQVYKSIEKGAVCLLGGRIPELKGAFYPATVLTNVKKGMPAYEEELFGPIATIISAKNEEEAIEIANDSVFGLGAAVFTKDLTKGENIASNLLESGCCFVNTFVKSDPRLPFGGIKESGYGRELSYLGIKEFMNIKTVYIK
jgi:succinate-semialdehyde dehydrogenase/glutarate-semialdehyde dehydrogenase